MFIHIHLHTILTQEISAIFLDQCQLILLSKKSTLYAGIKIINSQPSSPIVPKDDKGKFKAALRKY